MYDAYLKNVNITVTDGGYFAPEAEKAWHLDTHAAGIGKLYYIKEGACLITVEGKSYEGHPGDLFYIPAGARHSYSILKRPFKKYWMHLTATPAVGVLGEGCGAYLVRPDARALDTAFSHFCKAFGGRRIGDVLAVRAAAYSVLALYLDAAAPEGDGAPGGPLGEALCLMENSLSAPPKNRAHAERCHMHPTYFVRYFKAQTGHTPQAYLLKLRMERAGTLLRTSKKNISEIAECLGFYDGMYFSKVFKKYYSVAPSEYRRLYGRQE